MEKTEIIGKTPIAKGKFPWQSILKLAKNTIPFLEEKQKVLGDIYKVDAPVNFFVLTHPDYIKHVTVTNHSNYRKGYGYRNFSLMIGKGLITSEGEYWKKHRKLIQPLFHKEYLNSTADAMFHSVEEMTDHWKLKAEIGETVEVKDSMVKLSMKIIARSVFGKDSDEFLEELQKNILVEYDFVMKRNRTLFPLPLYVPTPKNIRFKNARNAIDRIIYRMIALRRNQEGHFDLLSMLIHSKDEQGVGLTDEEIRDEVLTMFIAGYDTTGYALSWTLYLIARHPDTQKKIREELLAFDENIPVFERSREMTFLKAVIQESLRLYPPIWTFGRQTIKEDEIGGVKIPANSHVLLSIYMVHRHPEFYENPNEFSPERFLERKIKSQAFIPFGAGPRMCIGNHFAMMEIEMTIAAILKSFEIKLKENKEAEIDPQITIRPKGDLNIILKTRNV